MPTACSNCTLSRESSPVRIGVRTVRAPLAAWFRVSPAPSESTATTRAFTSDTPEKERAPDLAQRTGGARGCEMRWRPLQRRRQRRHVRAVLAGELEDFFTEHAVLGDAWFRPQIRHSRGVVPECAAIG
jgi:hypothetical protein